MLQLELFPRWNPEKTPKSAPQTGHSGAQTRRTRAAPNGGEPTRCAAGGQPGALEQTGATLALSRILEPARF